MVDSGLGRFAVDISINQMNGIEAGRIINGMVKELPALRALVMVVKSFLSQRSLNEVYSGGISSYAVVCMAVSFLQVCVSCVSVISSVWRTASFLTLLISVSWRSLLMDILFYPRCIQRSGQVR